MSDTNTDTEQQDETSTDETNTSTDSADADKATDADLEAQLAKWKAMARKHEAASKSNADKAKRYDELEESQKTEQQKLADKAAAAEAKVAETAAELALVRAAVKHGLSEDDLELLGSHGTAEEIEERAQKLAARLKTAGEVKGTADFGGGDRGGDVGGAKQLSREDVKKLYAEGKHAEIEAARKEGRLDKLLTQT